MATSSGFLKKLAGGLIVAAATLVGIMVGAAAILWMATSTDKPSDGDAGTEIVAQDAMSEEEARQLVNERAEASRISISISSKPELGADGRLRVNMIVPQGNNGLSERIEIAQGGQVVYSSGVIAPGYRLEWTSPCDARPGPATATVYAVGADGEDSGNPVAVEVEIVEAAKESEGE